MRDVRSKSMQWWGWSLAALTLVPLQTPFAVQRCNGAGCTPVFNGATVQRCGLHPTLQRCNGATVRAAPRFATVQRCNGAGCTPNCSGAAVQRCGLHRKRITVQRCELRRKVCNGATVRVQICTPKGGGRTALHPQCVIHPLNKISLWLMSGGKPENASS